MLVNLAYMGVGILIGAVFVMVWACCTAGANAQRRLDDWAEREGWW